jgi:His-Xaa-Ser system protein HxsD
MRRTPRTPLTIRTTQASNERMLPEILVEFDSATQSLAALNAAAYRLIGTATCQIEQDGNRYLCRLSSREAVDKNRSADLDAVRAQFIDLVTDENLRERLAAKTEPVRNLILSLAFGSLAAPADDKS